jgi:hypothetical protein
MTQLAKAFEKVAAVMRQKQGEFNLADPYNGDHGDHMVEIFELAASAVRQQEQVPLPDAMDRAARMLERLSGNGSAQVYAAGMAQFSAQFRERNVSAAELVSYVTGVVGRDRVLGEAAGAEGSNGGEVLKALLAGLAGWRAVVEGKPTPQGALETGYLFDLGLAYMKAKTHGGDIAEVIAEAAISVSPLSEPPHRAHSGRLAIQNLLEVIGTGS